MSRKYKHMKKPNNQHKTRKRIESLIYKCEHRNCPTNERGKPVICDNCPIVKKGIRQFGYDVVRIRFSIM